MVGVPALPGHDRLAEHPMPSLANPTRPPSHRMTAKTAVHTPLADHTTRFGRDFTHRGGKNNGGEKMQPHGHRIAIEPPLPFHF
jgi:hypothetical protein